MHRRHHEYDMNVGLVSQDARKQQQRVQSGHKCDQLAGVIIHRIEIFLQALARFFLE